MNEAEVFAIVADELDSRGYESLVHVPGAHSDTYREVLDRHREHRVTIDGKYPDIIGLSPTDEVVAVEVKGDSGLDRGIGQAITYQRGSHRAFLAAEWDLLDSAADHLSHRGVGLLGVTSGTSGISEWIDPVGGSSPQQVQDVRGELISQLRLAGQSRRIGTIALAQPINFLAPVLAIDTLGQSNVSTTQLLSRLETQYGLKESSSRYCLKGAQVLRFVSESPHFLRPQGNLARATLAGEGIATLPTLASRKNTVSSVLHKDSPTIATLLRNAYLRHPDVQLLVDALDSFDGSASFIKLLERLVTQYPNAFLNVFCTQRNREAARKLIRRGEAKQIINDRENWQQFLRSNIVQNFVQQLKHIGILTEDTPSHSASLSTFDPVAVEWGLRQIQDS